MDVTAAGTGVPPAIDWLLCIIALLVFLKPRFDQWPASDGVPHAGLPKDYIHWARYLAFIGLYFASFILFVMALKMIPVAGQVVASEGNEFSRYTAQIMGQNSLVTTLMIALAALSNKQVAAVDERWRKCLLNLAQVPREAMALSDSIRQSLPHLIMKSDALETILARLGEQGQGDYWRAVLELPLEDARVQTSLPLLRALYLIQCIRHFEPNEMDSRHIASIELRLEEIAAMLPTRTADNDTATLQDYKKELKAITRSLAELLARHSVKHSPDAERRHALLGQQGFRVGYSDQASMDVLAPMLLSMLSIAVVSLLTLILSLHSFDLLHIPITNTKAGTTWLTVERVTTWGTGAVFSYAVAIAIGAIFGLVLQRHSQPLSIPNGILAVVFATLGSCVYYVIASDQIRPQLIWLSLAFGLMALVAIVSLKEDVMDMEHVRRRALQIALAYGAACAVLHAMISVSAAIYANRDITPSHLLVFASFGFVRGGLLAFLLSHIIMDYMHRHINGARRRYPRFSLRRMLQGTIGGRQSDIFVKDISEQGALLRLNGATPVAQGDAVSLRFDLGDLPGTVIWTRSQRARVKFNLDAQQLRAWQSFIRQNQAVPA